MKNISDVQFLRKELRLENWKLHHHDATVFCKSQWHLKCKGQSNWGSKAYLLYRWAVPLFVFFGGIVYDMLDYLGDEKCKTSELHCKLIWPIFVTNCNTMLLFVQTSFAAFLVTRHQYFPAKSGTKMQIIHKVYWAFNNFSCGLSLVVPIMYWGFLHKPEIHAIDYVNVREHMVFTAILLFDLMICAHPMRLVHFYQPLAICLTYIPFSAIYTAFGGVNRLGQPFIYDILDWSNSPGKAAAVAIATNVLVCFSYLATWAIHLFRRSLAKECIGEENSEKSETHVNESI